ncbi:MAG: hypothetical protein JJU08_14425 [Rhodobacteraceae bacterium]|nr:hypothetical protein [Paracoccaceae bacterium]
MFVPILEEWLRRRIIRQHDVFIFGFMTSLDGMLKGGPRLRDLKRLKALGKTVICVFHGSDVRPVWLNGSFTDKEPEELLKQGARKLSWLREIEKYADAIVSHPPMAPLQNRSYAQYLSVGIPTTHIKPKQQQEVERKSDAFQIVHAPSNPETKGTEKIKAVITKLRSEGYKIDLQLLINVPNSQVLATLRNADLLIDQVFSDTPMAHLATEAAGQSCPTVVCGYDLKALQSIVPAEDWPPTIIGEPDELYDCVKWALDHNAERHEIGRAAHAFVSERWRPEQVARNFLRLAIEGVPKEWQIDPKQKRFWGGYGMTLDQRDELVDNLVAMSGPDALGLPDDTIIPLPRP